MSHIEISPTVHCDGPRGKWTRSFDSAIGWLVEPAAGALIVGEVCILAASVYSRYILKSPLFWADELASILFLWLTMLGAVSAYRRSGHMRVTAFVRLMPPKYASALDVLNTVVVAAFSAGMLIAVVWPSVMPQIGDPGSLFASIVNGQFFASSYLGQESTDLTPALELPRTVEIFGIVTGLFCIFVLAVLRMIDSKKSEVLAVLCVVVLAGFIAFVGRDLFSVLGNFNLVLFFVVFIGAEITIGIPIAFAFGAATLSYLLLVTHVPLSIVIGQMADGMTNMVLLAIPLFVFLGLLLEATGIARRLVELIVVLVGRTRGGLNIVLVAAMFLVSGISGSKLADMAAVTPVLFPEMERRGHKRSEMIALLATSGAMAELIPPSLVLIIVGTVCNVSIQALFTGGLLPAAVASICLIVVALLRARGEPGGETTRPSSRARFRALAVAAPGLILPFLIRYFVVAGITTATEVSTIGIVYTLVVGIVVYREFEWCRLYPILRETAVLTGAIMLMIAMATAMGWALTQAGFAAALADTLERAPGGKGTFILLSILTFIVLGALLEGIPAIVLFGPLLFPIALKLGIGGIHYAIIVVLAMSIGMFTPPLGVGYYGACAVGKCDPDKAMFAMVPYLAALLIALAIIVLIPWLTNGLA